jgi:cytochrome c
MAFHRHINFGVAALFAVGLAFGGALSPAAAQEKKADDSGQVAFNNACRTCHTVKEGDNRLGPSLYGVVGRKAGTVEGFGYSDSMKQSGITWDEAQLDKFIANPEAVVPGNNMKPFGGIGDPEERKQIIAFLAQSGK